MTVRMITCKLANESSLNLERLTSLLKSNTVRTNWSTEARSCSASSYSSLPTFTFSPFFCFSASFAHLSPAKPNFGARKLRMLGVWLINLPLGNFRAGGAKWLGCPEFLGSVMVGRSFEGSESSVYAVPLCSKARRTYSPRPGIPGH